MLKFENSGIIWGDELVVGRAGRLCGEGWLWAGLWGRRQVTMADGVF